MPPSLLIPILAFLAILAVGAAVVFGLATRRRSVEPRLRSVQSGMAAGAIEDESFSLRMVGRLGGVAGGKTSLSLKEKLARAGYFSPSAAAVYMGMKLVLLVSGASGAIALMMWLDLPLAAEIYLGAMIAACFFFIPNIIVSRRRTARKNEIRRHLPDVIDMLEICVSAGMGLDMAWNSVADEIRSVSHVLADEMALTMLESQLGASRTVSMRNMADRTGAEELAGLVALLVQTDRFGTSIAEALRTFATSMREARSMRAEEAAEKTAVKLLFPLVFCIFPVMLIVTVGPAAITLSRIMGKG